MKIKYLIYLLLVSIIFSCKTDDKALTTVDVDCSKIKDLLTKTLSLDQEMRRNGSKIDSNIDRENLINVVSIIEKCGMPTLNNVDNKQMSAIWLVFQHADNYHRKKYLPLLKKSAENGDLRKSQLALMEDRTLMMDRKPQIYGSQVTKDSETGNWKIYNLENPESVDERRLTVGLGPLKDYVKRWNIDFNVKQSL